jgi:hypothetical protein
MKSAYELALERLENQGIRRPDDTALDEATRSKVEELRNQKEAKLAELEILHQDRLRKMQDPHWRSCIRIDLGKCKILTRTSSNKRNTSGSADGLQSPVKKK